MQDLSKPAAPHAGPDHASLEAGGRLKFAPDEGFQRELRRRVDAYLRDHRVQQRDCPRMYLKSGVILTAAALSYSLLVFVATAWWQAVPLALLLALAVGCVGFDIMHDAGHKAYSDRAWINRLMAMTLDLVGGSSYVWRWKHAVFHHMYVNMSGHDTDIELGIFGRLSPDQPHRAIYRWQHLYMWPLYGAMVMKWHVYDDFRDVVTARMGRHRFPRPRGANLAVFVGGKLLCLMLAFGLPLLFHPVWTVLGFYCLVMAVTGVILSVVFQLAHTVEEAAFPQAADGHIATPWAVHQVATTVDFARDSRVVSWIVGGLNFQIEHHLFPTLCHVNYPAIAPIVEATCREYGVPYTAKPSFSAGVASHYRWLRRMGQPGTTG